MFIALKKKVRDETHHMPLKWQRAEVVIMLMESYCFKKEATKALIHERWIEEYFRYAASCPDLFYQDPDETHKDGRNSAFYLRLVAFLSKRETLLKKEKPNERWTFEMRGKIKGNGKPSGIEVLANGETVMYLRSDQFGFSAPKHDWDSKSKAQLERYPYARYVIESNAPNKYHQVAEWIWNTRTIGGSFIWPIQKVGTQWKSLYNWDRGTGCYIQDRVDLTLFEVMKYYDGKLDAGDVLFKELERNPDMSSWLDHFGSFETFVEFFMFEDFCEKQNRKWVPKNIVTGDSLTEDDVNGIRSQGGVIQNLSTADIRTMLKNVSAWTLKRSKKIEDLLKSENTGGSKTKGNSPKSRKRRKTG